MSNVIRVVIVDDHPIVRLGLKTILEKEPSMEVVAEVNSGHEALEFARQAEVDIMVVDINLPDKDGLEIARVQCEQKLPFRIVIHTMYCDPEIFDQAIDLNVGGYVLKESAATDIVVAIQAVARGGHYFSSELSDLVMARFKDGRSMAEKRIGLELLTEAERGVLRLIASDRTTNEIADVLELSPKTVGSHRANICSKLKLRGSHGLLKFAFENRARLM